MHRLNEDQYQSWNRNKKSPYIVTVLQGVEWKYIVFVQIYSILDNVREFKIARYIRDVRYLFTLEIFQI